MISIRLLAPRLRFASACTLLIAALPSFAWAWSGAQHIQINKAAGLNVPEEMAAFRAFSRPMALPGIFPDLWKEADPAETPRHYFEPDQLSAPQNIFALSTVQAEALATLGLPAEGIGIAPWTITTLLNQMTDAMRTNDWVWAARCGATLGHYVADLHMPLHCTKNYNGDDTRQLGIHVRLEIDMTKAFFRPNQMKLGPALFIDDPFRSILDWTSHSTTLVPDILKADLLAKQSAKGHYDTEKYYRKLWNLTGDTITKQIGDATTHISSLWYTAWVNAGKPPIPEPLNNLPTTSVHSGVSINPPPEDSPVAAIPQQKKTYDQILWSVMGGIGLIIIASTLYRAIQAKRSKA